MKELLLYMAKNLVDNPDAVTVEEVTDEELEEAYHKMIREPNASK